MGQRGFHKFPNFLFGNPVIAVRKYPLGGLRNEASQQQQYVLATLRQQQLMYKCLSWDVDMFCH
jgi:hypothetical protein